jgi:hypothetical protein
MKFSAISFFTGIAASLTALIIFNKVISKTDQTRIKL